SSQRRGCVPAPVQARTRGGYDGFSEGCSAVQRGAAPFFGRGGGPVLLDSPLDRLMVSKGASCTPRHSKPLNLYAPLGSRCYCLAFSDRKYKNANELGGNSELKGRGTTAVFAGD